MANIVYGTITANSDYVDLEDEFDFSFESNKDYQIQIQNSCIICESTNKPTGGGFVTTNKPFTYTHKGSKLWVKTYLRAITINIAE